MSDPFLWIALACGIFSCFFAANNLALHQFSGLKLEYRLRERDQLGRLVSLNLFRAELMLLTALSRALLNLLVLFCSVVYFTRGAEVDAYWPNMVFAGIMASAIIFVMGVAFPYAWANWASEALLARSLPILSVLVKLFRPLMLILGWADPVMRRLVGAEDDPDDEYSPIERELLDVVSEGEKTGLVDEAQREMIEALIEFPSTTVGEIMTPRTDVNGIEIDATLMDVKSAINDAGHSRYPVYESDLDHIIGILYAKDLLQYVGNGQHHEYVLRDNLREPLLVPETKTVRDLLSEFQAKKVHVAIVVDEYGGTAGLVTIEDILEEIVGEIHDEYEPDDIEEPGITRLNETTVEIDARVYIDDLNDELEIELPENDDFDTVGGFVFATLGHIPTEGEAFDYENMHITVTEAEKTKVNRVKLQILDTQASES